MIIHFRSLVSVTLLVGILSACSSEVDTSEKLPSMLVNSLKGFTKARSEGPRTKTVVTSEMLAQTTTAALQVNPEARGGSDFLRRIATRDDSSFGKVEIWESSDNAQIFLRNGIVVGTRGIGGDIIAADANVTVKAVNARSDARGLRTYVISDGDVTTTEYQLRCELRNLGTEKISIVNRMVTTDRMREDCVGGPSGKVVVGNDFWVQHGTGLVVKSRQWMGPRTGYFELIMLKN